MKNIICDFCEKPIEKPVGGELVLTIRSRVYDQPNYPTQDYGLVSYDICSVCVQNLRNAQSISIVPLNNVRL